MSSLPPAARALLRAACSALAALVLASVAVPGSAAAASCSGRVDTGSRLVSNGFGFDLANTRNASSRIGSWNVWRLGKSFSHAAVGAEGKRGAAAITEQAVFFSAGLDIVAADRRTGCIYWSHTIPDGNLGTPLGKNHVRSSSVLFVPAAGASPALVVAADGLGVVHAVNAGTGELVWSRFAGRDRNYHWVTGGPVHHDGVLYVPMSSREGLKTGAELLKPCCSSHGLLHAMDVRTGQTRWIYDTTPNASFDLWQYLQTRTIGPSGAALWGPPTIDPVRRRVYIGTGQNYSLPRSDTANSIIALDMDTGRQRWKFQARADDAWNTACELPAGLDGKCPVPEGYDFDFGAPPILASLPGGGQSIIAGDKGGAVYSLDPDTGRLRWTRRVGRGSALGGIHWGMAVDRRNVYVPVTDTYVKKSTLFEGLESLLNGTGSQAEPIEGGSPGLYALDLTTGQQRWRTVPTHAYEGKQYLSIYSAAVSVTNDVLLAGALDGEVAAFRTSDGREITRFDTDVPFVDPSGNEGKGGSIDSVGPIPAGDSLFVNSGYTTFGAGTGPYQGGPGNALFGLTLR